MRSASNTAVLLYLYWRWTESPSHFFW